MKLVTVEAKFAAENRASAVAAFEASAGTVRAMAGCETYGVFPSDDGVSIVILQKWSSMEQFDAYRQSETFGEIGQSLKPLMSAPPVTTIASADG